MPFFLCPCCGGPYLVPLAYSEAILEAQGWSGGVAPVLCVNCQESLVEGTTVLLRSGRGITEKGTVVQLVEGNEATIIDVATWGDHGSIFLLQLAGQQQVYVSRAMVTTRRIEGSYYLQVPDREDYNRESNSE